MQPTMVAQYSVEAAAAQRTGGIVVIRLTGALPTLGFGHIPGEHP